MTTSTDLAKPDSFRALTIPDEDLSQAIEALQEQEIGEFDLTRIKIPTAGGQVWTVPSPRGEETVRELQGVIIFSKFARSYWHKPFTGGNEPPTCAASDGRHARAREIEGEGGALILPEIPAEKDDAGRLLCDTCHYAEFGSGRNPDGTPARKQACKQTRMVFLLLPDRLLPAVLVLPPTSLKSAKNYFLGLIDLGLAQHGIVTRFTLEKQKNEGTPEFSVARFAVGDPLEPEQVQRAATYAAALKPRFQRVVATSADLPDDA